MESWVDRVEAEERGLDLRQKMMRIAESGKKAREIKKGRPEWDSERQYWSDMEQNRKEINKLIDEIERQKKDFFLQKENDKKAKKRADLITYAKKNRKRFIAFLRKEKKHSIARDPAGHTTALLQKYKSQNGGRKRRKSRKRRRKSRRRRRKTRKH